MFHLYSGITIAKICRKKKDWCSHVAPRLLKSLLDCGVRGNVQIAADSAAQCCLAIVKNVPDNRKGDLTATIIDGCQDRGYSVTIDCNHFKRSGTSEKKSLKTICLRGSAAFEMILF